MFVESQGMGHEPWKDKRKFLLSTTLKIKLNIHIIQADGRGRLTQADISRISESHVVIFDRIFLLQPFELLLEKHALRLGEDVVAAVLEDDWIGDFGHWTRWSNQRLELGSLAVDYLSCLLQGTPIIDRPKLVPLHLIIGESSAFG